MSLEPEVIEADVVAELLPEAVTKSLAARLCGVSRPTLDRLLADDRIELGIAGRVSLIDVEELRGGRRVTLVDYLRSQRGLDAQAGVLRAQRRGNDLRALHMRQRAVKALGHV